MDMERYVRKILIVEDDLALKPIWEKFFKVLVSDAVVEWAVSCEEAIKMIDLANASNESYSLIITDIFLAGSKTGMELIKSPEVAASKARTVMVSAADRNEITEKFGHLMPQTLVISKPFDFKTYNQIFKKILEESSINEGVGI